MRLANESEWVIKFNGLSGDRGHRGSYSSYKPGNHSLYIEIIFFPHIGTHNLQATINFKKKRIKKKNNKEWGHPLRWQIIGEKRLDQST